MLVGLIAIVIGLLLWLFAGHPKLGESGRILFAIGLLLALVALSMMAGGHVDLPVLR